MSHPQPSWLDRRLAARPGTRGAARWAARMPRVRWGFWSVVTGLLLFGLLPFVAQTIPEDAWWRDWVNGSWALLIGVALLVAVLVSRFARPFDLGLVGPGPAVPPNLRGSADAPASAEAKPSESTAPAASKALSRSWWLDLRFTLLASIGLAAFYAAVGTLIYAIDPPSIERVLAGRERAVALIFATVVAAPIGEEILFRGFLHPVFRREYGPGLGLVLGAFVFGLMHAVFNFSGLIHLNHLFGGLVFGYAYENTGSLWPPLVLHTLGNSSLLLLLLLPL